jgi:hypothetical protein
VDIAGKRKPEAVFSKTKAVNNPKPGVENDALLSHIDVSPSTYNTDPVSSISEQGVKAG